jgi:hypothetical protein
MTGRERRAAKAACLAARAESIRMTYEFLVDHPAPTLVGATLILPDGEATYISAEDARAFHCEPKKGGRA